MDDEYLITNQLGGYSSSTFHSGNIRKYHGLLIVSNTDLKRKLIIGNLEEKINDSGVEKFFSTNIFHPNVVSPDGKKFLKNYAIHSQTITFEYNLGSTKVFKEVNLAQEANTVIVRYKIVCEEKINFTVAPLITNRSIHELSRYTNAHVFASSAYLNNATIKLSPAEELTIKVLSFNPKNLLNVSYAIKSSADIYKNFHYPVEDERGYDSTEDLIKPLEISFCLQPGESFISMQFSYENSQELLPSKINNSLKLLYSLDYKKKEIKAPTLIEFKEFLNKHYHEFLVDNNFHKSIIAGFHWFDGWGRDTFISFPGLLLATNEFNFARQLLSYWGNFIRDGQIPNSLEGKSYNSIDASLWYIVSIYKYYHATKDEVLIKGLFPKISEIINEFLSGSNFSINVDDDGYLNWTDASYNLTWMDSQVKSKTTTNRLGACVEVQMLWYNCLKIYLFFAKELGITKNLEDLESMVKRISQKFPKDFWNADSEYAFDFIIDGKADNSIRPNVILGLSLPFKLFDKKKAELIISKAKKELVTDLGMLTLNKSDKNFIGRYSGTQSKRDLAYHNGTIWPYLLGFYFQSIVNYFPGDKEKITEVKEGLANFWTKIKEKELNYLPELFSPDDLHPDGCLSQAWNYGTFLELFKMMDKK